MKKLLIILLCAVGFNASESMLLRQDINTTNNDVKIGQYFDKLSLIRRSFDGENL